MNANSRIALAFAGFTAVVLGAHAAQAEPTAAERAEARALFNDGRKLMNTHDYAAACPKLEESERLDPGIGTQFNLADCQEHIGKIASASENYLEVANAAKVLGQSAREAVARSRAEALASKVSRLVIAVDAGVGEGVTVRLDGIEVRAPLWGTAVPTDAGDHEVVVSAPGRASFRKVVHVPNDASTVSVHVPKLIDATPGVVENLPAASSKKGLAPVRKTAIVVAGVGVVALGAGGIVGLVAKGKANDSNAFCNPKNLDQCSSHGVDVRNDARSLGNVATVIVVAGAAAVGIGAVLWITAPGKASTAQVGVGPGSIQFGATF